MPKKRTGSKKQKRQGVYQTVNVYVSKGQGRKRTNVSKPQIPPEILSRPTYWNSPIFDEARSLLSQVRTIAGSQPLSSSLSIPKAVSEPAPLMPAPPPKVFHQEASPSVETPSRLVDIVASPEPQTPVAQPIEESRGGGGAVKGLPIAESAHLGSTPYDLETLLAGDYGYSPAGKKRRKPTKKQRAIINAAK